MKPPRRLLPLLEDGLIDAVISQLMSGKEATVYLVRCGDEVRCAKVYKAAAQRSFKKAVQYREGRKVRNSRQARAMENRSKYGRKQEEEAWHDAEVNALYKLAAADVRVPQAYGCVDGVLLMELISDDDGLVAPRLGDVSMSAEQAIEDHELMMRYIVRMLCAGVIHGDLSEFNVLVDAHGPVIIDLPQAVDAAANNNAEAMLTRDVEKIRDYYALFAPALQRSNYAREIWSLYEAGDLHPETPLTGEFHEDLAEADVDAVLLEIKAALEEEQQRRERLENDES